jgi:hypothetical protein
MSERRKVVFVTLVIAVLLAIGTMVKTAAGQTGQKVPAPSEARGTAAAREAAAKQLLLLMDRNKDGKVSKQEWMSFMEKEFDRLDTDHDGYVNAKDMEKSQLGASHFYKAGK